VASPPAEGGITIFDNDLPRPTRANGVGGSFGGDYQSLQWGMDASNLFGADLTDFHTLSVTSSGVTPVADYPLGEYSLTPYVHIHFDSSTGYVYADDGRIINPATGNIVANLNNSGFVVPDSSTNRIFLLNQTTSQIGSANYTIESFDQTTFAPISSTVIPNIQGAPQSFIRWGTSGLALVTFIRNTASYPSGMLYILNDSTIVSASNASSKQLRNRTGKSHPAKTLV
jgi:hypothetical protein